jgi:uncharacterized repeat protein (TIGR01451 family)
MIEKRAIGQKPNTNARPLSSLVFGVFFFAILQLLSTSAYADIDNSAVATGTSASGPVTSNTSVVAVPLTPQSPSIAIVKNFDQIIDANGNSYQDAGDTINYNLIVTNTGNVSLDNVTVTDPGATITGSPIATMLPGATANLTATHIITAADLLAGVYDNQASVTGTPTVGAAVSDLSDPASTTSDGFTTVTLTAPSGVLLDKSVASITDVNGNGITDAGDQINYAFNVTNNGAAGLTNLTVTDPLITLVGAPIPVLLPGNSNNTAYTGTYILTQANVDAGQFVNTAQVDATTPSSTIVSDTDIETTAIPRTPAIAVVKAATPNFGANGIADAGETISYQFSVTNTGNTTLTNISIADTGATVSGGPLASLLPGISDAVTFTATHTLTQTEINAGTFSNQATANATSPTGPVTDQSDNNSPTENDPTQVTLAPQPGIALVKSIDSFTDTNTNGVTDAGDSINYVFAVTNTGNVTLTGVSIVDPLVTISGSPLASLAPGVTNSSITASHVITVADVNAGTFQNQATASGTPPVGAAVTDLSDDDTITGSDPTVAPLTPAPRIALLKTITGIVDTNGSGTQNAGDTVNYAFTVRNTGNVTLTNVTVVDADPLVTVTGGPIASLNPGQVDASTFTASHTLTQADMDAGFHDNTATTTGTPPTGPDVTDFSHPTGLTSDGPTRATLTPVATVTIDKVAASVTDINANGLTDAGDRINYSFAVTNTGTVTLTNVTVTDPGVTLVGAPIAALAPGASDTATYTATYILQQADINTGQYVNTAQVQATTPDTSTITDNDVETSPITRVSSMTLLKTATPNFGANGTPDAGDTIAYAFTVTNTGTTTLSNISIADPLVTVSGGPLASLAPGVTDFATFTATYTLTQSDVNAGTIANQATANATSPTGPVSDVSDDGNTPALNDPTTLTLPRTSGVALVKTVPGTTDTNGNGITDAGDVINYQFTVTNIGNVTLTNVAVTDLSAVVTGEPLATLAPGAVNNTTFTATHVITVADMNTGSFQNQAVVNATAPTGPVTDQSDESDNLGNDPTSFSLTPAPGIAVLKTLVNIVDTNTNAKQDAGDTVNYAFTIRNTGNVTLTNVTLTDPGVVLVGAPIASLAPGVSNTTASTASYALTQADLDQGFFDNQAFVTGTPPSGPNVTDASHPTGLTSDGATRATLTPVSSIQLVKSSTGITDLNGNGVTDVGDQINYAFAITNTGTTSLTNVNVIDPLVTVTGTQIASLAPGDTNTSAYQASHILTQPEIDNGQYLNSATVRSASPGGAPITDVDAVTVTYPATSSVALIKQATPNFGANGTPDAGDTIAYTFTVTNTGVTTLTNVSVSDPSAIVSGAAIPTLLPGQSTSTNFTATYTLTQADVNAGTFSNQATTSATGPAGPVTDQSDNNANIENDPTVTTLPAQPAIALVKSVGTVTDANTNGVTDTGDIINYTIAVTNTGNVTLTNVTVTDPAATLVGAPIASLAPGVTNATAYAATHAITLADMNAGQFSNQATVNGTTPASGTVSDQSDESDLAGNDPTVYPLVPSPSVAVLMYVVNVADTNGNGRQDAGDTVTYGYTVTNTGNVSLTSVTVNNPQVTLGGAPIANLVPGQTNTTTYTSTYILTLADADAGFFDNQADVVGTTPTSSTVTDISHPTGITSDGPTRVTVAPSAALALVKAVNAIVDVDSSGTTNVGDRVDYTFLVTNTGSVTVSNIVLTDANATVTGTPISSLAPAASNATNYSAQHILTQADIDAGQFINTATVNGLTPGGNTVTASDDETAAYTVASSLTLDKTAALNAGPDGIANVGDTVTYTFNVTNTGVTTLRNVRIDDPLLSASNITSSPQAMTNLALAQTDADPISTATITEEAVRAFEPLTPIEERAAASFAKAATLFAPNLSVPSVNAALYVERDPVLMTGDSNAPKAGDEIGIVFRISNAGEAPLTAIHVEQSATKPFADKLDLLANNQTDVGSILLLHVLTAEEAASGKIMSPARVTARSRNETITVGLQDPILLADIASFDEIATAAITPSNAPTLAPGQTFTFNATHVLTQANIDAGVLDNTATALGTGHNGDVSNTDSATTPLPAQPSITLVKIATPNLGSDGIANAGDTIAYAFTVENTGNVTLNNVTINDPKVAVTGTLTSLAPQAVDITTFSATYTITQADIDVGRFENQAIVSGTPPTGAAVTDASDDNDPAGSDPTVVVIAQSPGIAITKNFVSFNDLNGNGITDLADTATFKFTVTNTGNVSLSNVTVSDPIAAVTGGPITLAPAAVDATTFTATVIINQPMLDAGEIRNQAKVQGNPPTGPPVTDLSHPTDPATDAETVTEVPQQPAIALVKTISSITDNNGNGVTDLGDTINYAFAITNTGNVTLEDVILTDNNAVVSGGQITMAPAAFNASSFTAKHVVVAGDVAVGRVVNQATVTGRSRIAGAVSDASDNADPNGNEPTVTEVTTEPNIAIVKTVSRIDDTNSSDVTDAGDIITYAFTVTNTGNANLSNVTLTELLPGAVVNGTSIPTLLVGASDSITFTATYTIKQTDVAAGRVENQVRVQALAPGNKSVSDLSDDASAPENDPTVTTINNQPGVALVKTVSRNEDVNGNGISDLGDIIHYTFAVHNTGNVPLNNVTLIDENAVVSGGPITRLAAGVTDTSTFTAKHVLVQTDIDEGGVQNQATVSATSTVSAGPITDDSDDNSLTENNVTFLALVAEPRIALVKRVAFVDDKNGNGIHDVGDIINYAFTVTNTGNVTVSNIVVTDTNAVMSPGSLLGLAPGQSNGTTFKATHKITIPEGTAGFVSNKAEVSALSPTGVAITDLSDESSITGNDPTVINVVLTPPDLAKTAQRSQVARGDIVPYTIRATNVQGNTFFIRDIMPPGFQFKTGSATANGIAITPALSGRTLTFTGLTATDAGVIEIKLNLIAAVTSQTGKFVNKAEIVDTNSGNVADRAEATVTIKEEHVFDCSDIIGRVFDDLNGNGYADDGEPGLPGVRLVTVNGRIITTDDKGRFSVPCADVPKDNIGANYILKLDPKSLPAGYQLTTENPRMVRVTPGKVVKLNFGAQGTRNVQLDIRKDAFIGNGISLAPKWADGLGRLVEILKKSKGNLDIVYRCGIYAPIADERLEALEEAIQAKWEEEGSPHKLKINSRVECGK